MYRWTVALMLATALLLTLGTSTAVADQIGLSGATGTATLTRTAGGITVNFGTFTGTGTASFQQPTGLQLFTGNFTLTLTSGPFTLTQVNPGNYTVAMGSSTLAFSVTSNAAAPNNGTLTGNWNLKAASDGTGSAKLVGSMLVGTNSFTDWVLADWPVGKTTQEDFTLLLSSSTVDALWLASNGTSVTAAFSSGEVLPVPEPVAVFLFGGGMLVVGTFLRRRKK
jgi:hypothetical protein